MLESYRVMFLQRPPGFYPKFTALNNGSASDDSASHTSPRPPTSEFTTLLCSLLTPHLDYGNIITPLNATFCLTYLIVLSWHTKSRDTSLISSDALWKQALIELALHKWRMKLESSVVEITPWQKLLLHSAFVNIHADLNLILRLVRTFARSFKLDKPACAALESWRESDGCKVALWHATELTNIAKAQTIFTHQSITDDISSNLTEKSLPEAPHLCAGIYMATLTLWSGDMIPSKPDRNSARSTLESGIHILSCLNVRMASVLQNVLRHLLIATIHDSGHNV